MYALLTGAISNTGDFLIKEKAIELLKFFKPKRKIITFDRWESLTEEQINIINNSRLLILCGGPAFQRNLYPGIYPLIPGGPVLLVKNLPKLLSKSTIPKLFVYILEVN